MVKYIIRRLLQTIPVLIGVSILVFSLMHLIPGDAAQIMAGEAASEETVEQLREKLGLNEPLYISISPTYQMQSRVILVTLSGVDVQSWTRLKSGSG